MLPNSGAKQAMLPNKENTKPTKKTTRKPLRIAKPKNTKFLAEFDQYHKSKKYEEEHVAILPFLHPYRRLQRGDVIHIRRDLKDSLKKAIYVDHNRIIFSELVDGKCKVVRGNINEFEIPDEIVTVSIMKYSNLKITKNQVATNAEILLIETPFAAMDDKDFLNKCLTSVERGSVIPKSDKPRPMPVFDFFPKPCNV